MYRSSDVCGYTAIAAIINLLLMYVSPSLSLPAVPIHFLLECPDCENGTCDSCPLHCVWKTLPGQPAVGLDKPSKRFTSVPIPAHWRVQESIIPGAGLGLFTQTHMPCGTRMGPYRGERRVLSQKTVPNRDMCYAWEVSCFLVSCVCMRLSAVCVCTCTYVCAEVETRKPWL